MADQIKSKEKIMEKQKIEKTVKNEELLPNILYETRRSKIRNKETRRSKIRN